MGVAPKLQPLQCKTKTINQTICVLKSDVALNHLITRLLSSVHLVGECVPDWGGMGEVIGIWFKSMKKSFFDKNCSNETLEEMLNSFWRTPLRNTGNI